MFLEVLAAIILFILGLVIGRFTTNKKSQYVDFCLVIFSILFNWIGKDSYLMKVFDLEIRLPFAVQLILLGMLINRLVTFYASRNRVGL